MSLGTNLNKVANKIAGKFGAAVTFTTVVPGAHDAATGTFAAPTTSTVIGYAVRDGDNPERYKALGIVESEVATLFFTPTTYGQRPPLGASVVWGGEDWTVRDASPLAPDGTDIASSVVIVR